MGIEKDRFRNYQRDPEQTSLTSRNGTFRPIIRPNPYTSQSPPSLQKPQIRGDEITKEIERIAPTIVSVKPIGRSPSPFTTLANIIVARTHVFLSFIPKLFDSRKKLFISGSVLVLLVAGGLGWGWLISRHDITANDAPHGGNGSLSVNSPNGNGSNLLTNASSAVSGNAPQPVNIPKTALNFVPAVPAGESQLADLGSKNFNSTQDSYTYDDLFLAEPLVVSEQPIPMGATISQIAKYDKANNQFATTNGTAYMNTNSSGLQTVIYSTQGLLVFVQSDYQHTTAQWATYLESLQ